MKTLGCCYGCCKIANLFSVWYPWMSEKSIVAQCALRWCSEISPRMKSTTVSLVWCPAILHQMVTDFIFLGGGGSLFMTCITIPFMTINCFAVFAIFQVTHDQLFDKSPFIVEQYFVSDFRHYHCLLLKYSWSVCWHQIITWSKWNINGFFCNFSLMIYVA